MVTMGPSSAFSAARWTGAKSAKSSCVVLLRSAIRLASPPEQLTEAMDAPGSGPTACSNFRVSRNTAMVSTSMIPRRLSSADPAAALPASEAVWVMVAKRALSERPILMATTGLPLRRALGGEVFQRADIAKALEIKTDGADPVVVEQRRGDVAGANLGLVAGGYHIGNRQAAGLHGHVDGDVGGLGDNRHAAVDREAAMLIGPERHIVEIVDEAVAIGSEDRHVPGALISRA
jgi:hypothetical protein